MSEEERGDRWIVVPIEPGTSRECAWVVRDQAGELGDLWQRHRGQAERIATLRNRRQPWSAIEARRAVRQGQGVE